MITERMKRNTAATIFCVLSCVVSSYCIYQYIAANIHGTIDPTGMSTIIPLNRAIDTINNFNERLQVVKLFLVGMLALIFELAFSDSMHKLFSQLPLGSIKIYDFFADHKFSIWKTFKHTFAVLSPAAMVTVYILAHIGFLMCAPDQIGICVKWFLPIAALLAIIAAIIIAVFVVRDGGLWGALIRLPLIYSSNLCLCTITGALIFGLALGAVIIIPMLIAIPIALKLGVRAFFKSF